MDFKNIVIVGLGLIGGSIAKAANAYGYSCKGIDIDEDAVLSAIKDGVITECWNGSDEADLYIVALYESDTIKYIRDNINSFKKGSVIIDICGNKRGICSALTDLCKTNGLNFVGTHPMQGRTSSGYRHSVATLFDGASIIVCRDKGTNEEAVKSVGEFAMNLRFKKIINCSPDEHDAMLSYTSQLAHILSSVYIQNEKSQKHIGFSAGSFRDLSRVSELSAVMWSELMTNNSDNLISDIECFEEILHRFKTTLQDKDTEKLHDLLSVGNEMKLKSKKGN